MNIPHLDNFEYEIDRALGGGFIVQIYHNGYYSKQSVPSYLAGLQYVKTYVESYLLGESL